MASSAVEIANIALDMLGAKPLVAFTDGNKSAELCARNYPLSRDFVLRSYPWNDATTRVAMAALSETPAWGYDNQYQLPVDCLRVIVTEGDQLYGVPWRIEAGRLLCDDAGPVNIRYIRKIEDPGLIGPMLAQVIAAHMAKVICFAITGNNTQTEQVRQDYERVFRDARRIDALEQSQDEAIVADDWTTARLTAYGQVR